MNFRVLLTAALFLFFSAGMNAQTAIGTLKGLLIDSDTRTPLSGALITVKSTGQQATTDSLGAFKIADVPQGQQNLVISLEGFEPFSGADFPVLVNGESTDAGTLVMRQTGNTGKDAIPSVTLTDSDLNESSVPVVSGVLTSARDPFISASVYTFSAARFRARGYYNENMTFMNGLPMEDLASGRTTFSTWSGLNDVIRSRENTYGLAPSSYTYGSLDGSTSIDSKASRQRKQMQLSYALSNRSYDNRIMATYGSGLMKGGWSVAASLSRRWAEEGYVEGTYYDSWSWFASVEKRINSVHSISLTHMTALVENGRATAATQEAYDLTGSNYYNPNWGYQAGEKRNASVARQMQPLTVLSHEWKINTRSELETSIGYQFGEYRTSGLDWFNAADPRPDFYRYMPSYIPDSGWAADATMLWENNDNVHQINWDRLYDVNYHNIETINDADGIAGNTVSGRRSRYILQDRVTDSKRLTFASTFNHVVNDHSTISAGINYQTQRSDNFKEVNDLLGGDFYVDLNQYAEQDFPGDSGAIQNDLNNPNNILKEGDKFGYDYRASIQKAGIWVQDQFSFDHVDFFVAAQFTQTEFFRTGYTRYGIFPENSYGDSEKKNFTNYAFKGGVTYKLNGRNYFFLNGTAESRAPMFDNSFVSPRTRNSIVEGLKDEKITGIEGGYLLRAPRLKIRATGYLTMFNDGTRTVSYYHEDFRTFVNYSITNIDRRHAGIELGADASLGHGFTATAAIAMGQHIYTSRQEATITQDNDAAVLSEKETVYSKNFYVANGAQSAYTAGLGYRSKNFWFVTLNANFFDDIYIDFAPGRRTVAAVDNMEVGDLRNSVIEQEQADAQFTLDFFGGKSWKLNNKFKSLKRNTFIVLNAGVNNILNNTDFVTGGYEQLRFDFREKNKNKFATKYFYGYGTTYYISLILRMN